MDLLSSNRYHYFLHKMKEDGTYMYVDQIMTAVYLKSKHCDNIKLTILQDRPKRTASFLLL